MFRRITAVICILVMACSLVACNSSEDDNDYSIESVKLEDNQSIVCGKITNIKGNEISITFAKKTEVTVDSSQMKNHGNKEQSSGQEENQDSTDQGGDTQGSSAQGGGPQGGTPPDGGMSGGNMQQAPGGDIPDSSDEDASDKESSNEAATMYSYELTDETETYTIPVGAKVTTQLGAVTTFSRLAVDDIVEMIVQKDTSNEDVIIGIWIEE